MPHYVYFRLYCLLIFPVSHPCCFMLSCCRRWFCCTCLVLLPHLKDSLVFLALPCRSVTPFVAVSSHCPFYSSNTHHHLEWQTLAMQGTFEPLFMEHEVDIVFAGHVHAYQRSHPVYKDQVTEGAPVNARSLGTRTALAA